MRVGIQGWGSEGDLRPLITLAAQLRGHGHDVRLILSPVDGLDYRPLCARLEVPFALTRTSGRRNAYRFCDVLRGMF